MIAAVSMTINAMAQQLLPYQNYRLSAEERAKDLISRLTLEEKAQLMVDQSDAIERLGIPQFQWWNEALHGTARNGYATVFPITMGMAASWNDALLLDCFSAASDEARAKYMEARRSGNIKRYQCLSFWTPNINIFRDPRWGRGQETYGEDPYLTSRMGLAVVNGLQGPKDSKYMKTLACAKHFAVHSGPEWNRHSFNVEDVPARDLWETYLPAFKALVQKGDVAEVMCAYQRIDGEPCCSNKRYLQQILRDEWGFKGIVVTDCWALRDFYAKGCHEVTTTVPETAARALINGTDAECGSVFHDIPTAVRTGQVSEETINASLMRLLTARFRLGEMTPDSEVEWTKIPESTICSDEHSDLAYHMAQQSMVLLQNNNDILPLSKSNIRIAVMGPNANDSIMQWGNYSGFARNTTTILDGIRKKVDGSATITYIGGCGHTRNEVKESRFNEISHTFCMRDDGKDTAHDASNHHNAPGTISCGEGKGMQATYWNNIKMEGTEAATATMTEPINLSNGGATVFAPGVELENFSARYTGTFHPTRSEHVYFSTEADDGFRLIINGDTIFNRFGANHGVRNFTHGMEVKAGEKYDIQIDYIQTNGLAHIKFDVYAQEEMSQESIIKQLKDVDVVVFVGGISPRLEGEEMKVDAKGFKGGDRTDIELPDVQRDMLKAIHDAGHKIVYINCSGSAIALVPETESCDAIMQAWYPGQRGGDAVADVLFGDYNPSGKLPITFYRSVNDLPDFLDYNMKGRTYRYFEGEALWPFGYGQSYTKFEISKPVYDKKAKAFNATIKNIGTKAGEEVVQLYVRRTADTAGPKKTLRGFQRINLAANESATVSFPITDELLECWDEESNTMRVIPGNYEIMIGNSSKNEDLKTLKYRVK